MPSYARWAPILSYIVGFTADVKKGMDDDRHHNIQRPFIREGTTGREPLFDLVHVALKSRVAKKGQDSYGRIVNNVSLSDGWWAISQFLVWRRRTEHDDRERERGSRLTLSNDTRTTLRGIGAAGAQ